MKKLILLILIGLSFQISYSQDNSGRCIYKGVQVPANPERSLVGDFTITDTQGNVLNLYNTLDSGKTVFIDLFFTTCGWCQTYAPIIEQVYQNHGAGQGSIVFWGVSTDSYDSNPVIDAYKTSFNVTNPCAGPAGGGAAAHNTIIAGQNFLGWPTYCVICPDKSMFFDPCYPPTVTGFDTYIEQCANLTGIGDNQWREKPTQISSIYPNPVITMAQVDIILNKPSKVSLEVYNLLGEKVMELNQNKEAGPQHIDLDLGRMPKGQYFVKLLQN